MGYSRMEPFLVGKVYLGTGLLLAKLGPILSKGISYSHMKLLT